MSPSFALMHVLFAGLIAYENPLHPAAEECKPWRGHTPEEPQLQKDISKEKKKILEVQAFKHQNIHYYFGCKSFQNLV